MLLLVLTVCLLLESIPTFAASITVSIDNPPESGVVEMQLYDSATSFAMQHNPVFNLRVDVDSPKPYVIDGLTAGEFALRVYYDENNNNSVDRNFIGIPVEPVGFSNRYTPRARPDFSPAAFILHENEVLHIDVKLYQPLGKGGQLSVGPGVIFHSSPYRESHGYKSQFIPAISYLGERLQIFGPRIQWGIAGAAKYHLALAGQYRMGVYQEQDSPFLAGMDDRKSTFLAGLSLQLELPAKVDVELSYKHDVLDIIGGGEGRLRFSRSLQFGNFRLTPQLGVNYLSSELSNYDFGIPSDKATATRPAYQPGHSISIEAGIGLLAQIKKEWVIQVSINYEKFSDDIVESPIINQDSIVKGFASVNYVF